MEMLEDILTGPAERSGDPDSGRHTAVDGLIAGRNEVWVLLARPGDDYHDLLWSDGGMGAEDSTTLCRAVLDHGVLLMGSADPDNDPLLSDLLRGGDSGTA